MRDLFLMALMALACIGLVHEARAQDDDSAAGDDDDSAHLVNLEEHAEDIKAAIEGVKEAKDSGNSLAMFIAISALIATVLKLMLDLLKALGGQFFRNKRVLKLITVILGFLIYLFAQFGLGVSWEVALLLALAGPGAMVVNELGKLIKDGKKESAGNESG